MIFYIRMCIFLILAISFVTGQNKYVTPRLDDGTPWLKQNDIKYNRLGYVAATFIIADAIAVMKLKETWYN